MSEKHISCYYGKYQKNFGDLLTPLILDYYLKRYISPHYHIQYRSFHPMKIRPQIVGMGSLLDNIPSHYSGHIWTTGNAQPGFRLQLNHRDVCIHAVRGRLTLDSIDIEHPPKISPQKMALGDGALLLPRIFPRTNPPDVVLGLVPHVCDYDTVHSWTHWNSNPNIMILNLRDDPSCILEQIKRCHYVLSSSLHGLVVADAYGIPNGRFQVTTSQQIVGGSWKFQDYYTCFDIDPDYIPPVIHLHPEYTVKNLLEFIHQQHNTFTYIQSQMLRVTEKLHQATVNMIQQLKRD